MKLEIAPEAEADLDEISDYIALDDPSRARTFINEIEGEFLALLGFPDSGRDRSELLPGLRSKPYGKYLIFYLRHGDTVRIERVLHGARNLTAIFASPS